MNRFNFLEYFTETDNYVSLQLDICQANACLEIKDVPIPLTTLTPALKAISYYQNLQKICLSGVYLRDQGFKVRTYSSRILNSSVKRKFI